MWLLCPRLRGGGGGGDGAVGGGGVLVKIIMHDHAVSACYHAFSWVDILCMVPYSKLP